MSKWPFAASSNNTDSITVRRLHSTSMFCCSIAWIACAHSLNEAMSRTMKSRPLMPLPNPAAAMSALASLTATPFCSLFLPPCREYLSGFVHPERILPADVIGTEVVVGAEAFDVVVPNVVDFLPCHGQQWRVLLEDRLRLTD